ncbi:MAG: C25 family peptidase propeptide domain-containing protein, partial [Candidatus Kapaibacterium sp.]
MRNTFIRSKLHNSLMVNPLAWRLLRERVRFASIRFSPFAYVAVAFLVAAMPFATLRAQQFGASSYEVLSVTPQEVILRIQPKYESRQVRDTSGFAYTEMTFPGGITTDSAGAQEIMRLRLNFLTPNTKPASVGIVSQSLEVLPNIDLAPVPTNVKAHGDFLKTYIVRDDRYYNSASGELIQTGAVHTFRTAYSEQVTVSPISYDPGSRSVTRVKSLTLRIRFSGASSPSPSLAISSEEASLFRAMFINGGVTGYYSGAWHANAWNRPASKSSGISVLSSATDGGQWVSVTTGAEGIYHITTQDLAGAGVTGTIDPSTIELFGMGGEMLNETVTDSSGEWVQRPLDVRTNGSSMTEIDFYAPGV